MHLGILPFRIYISSKTYVLKDQTLYIFYKRKNNNNNNNNNKKMDFMCDRKLQQNFYFTNCNGSVTVLLHNARTGAL